MEDCQGFRYSGRLPILSAQDTLSRAGHEQTHFWPGLGICQALAEFSTVLLRVFPPNDFIDQQRIKTVSNHSTPSLTFETT